MRTAAHPRRPLPEGPFDLAVVGGGINGAAIARDAALRGKSVILVERGDIGEGTSSRTSKMAHGGIRYLEQLRLGLVFESLRERGLLLRNAPHLVRPQAFVLPIYAGAKRGPRMVRLGLFLYDALALGRSSGRCRFLSSDEVASRVPHLLRDGLVGGGLYYDAVMDDARLVLANALAALEETGPRVDVIVRNHASVTSVRPGSPAEVAVLDRVTGEEATVLAHRVVRALGPWTEPERLVPSKGVHIVLPALPMPEGLLLTHSRDGRAFFLVPWLGRTVVGTTETPFHGPPDALRVEPGEVSYLLDEVRRLFPGLRLGPGDILATFAGVRPLARERGLFRGGAPGAVSRVHRIEERDGVLSVFGGKYTTHRAVAEEVVGRAFPGTPCSTRSRPLPGGEARSWDELRRSRGSELARLDPALGASLFARHGTRMLDVLRVAEEDPSLREALVPGEPVLRAEVVHAARRELAFYPEDFMARRTALRFSADRGRSAYDAVEALLREHAPAVPPDLARARERYFAELDWEDRLRGAPGGTYPGGT
ncbi:MAG: glycerol-3-phosphate dehydrogenase/oxidase [Planctomycetes bacterium]|nr:glycerol-3-phosphate dehydrogenase/oxidase [Planctomycetota bacterium]